MGFGTDERLKGALLASGKWADFVRVRKTVTAFGLKGKAKLAAVLKQVSPDIMFDFVTEGDLEKAEKELAAAKAGGEVTQVVPKNASAPSGDQKASVSTREFAIGAHVSDRDGLTVHLSMHDGKKCSWSDAVSWAYVHSGVEIPSERKAPSALAWKLLIDFRRSPAYAQDLFKGVIVAKTKKEEVEERYGEGDFDGKDEYDILSRLGEGGVQ